MSKHKREKQPIKIPDYHFRYIIFIAAFFFCFTLNLVIALGLFDFFLGQAVGKWIAIAVISLGSITLLVLALLSFSASKKIAIQKRLNAEIFPLLENVFDERELIENAGKLLRRHKNEKAGVFTFSTFGFKKEIFLRYGYQKESEVISIIFVAIEGLRDETNNKMIYGYDYSDNFIVFMIGLTEKVIQNLIEKLTVSINRLLGENKLEIDFYPHYGAFYKPEKSNIKAESMFQNALIASDHGRLSSERGGIFFFKESMFNKNDRNVELARDIENGLANKEFEVYFQPKYDLKLKRFVAAEALIRWHHPERGTILPGAFLSLAEQSDLIIEIDYYVIDLVCKRIAEWRDKGLRLLPISINLSKRTVFTVDIADYIERIIKKHQVNPLLLEVEIVESPSPYDILFLLATVKKIKALNIKVAIDDFGTGFSSLSYIKRIPFDVIKIDKAFLSDLEIDFKSRGMLKEIIKLAHILETYVVIEGVQEYEQVRLLQSMDADCIQGFYYSEALKADDYLQFIADNRFEKGRKGK